MESRPGALPLLSILGNAPYTADTEIAEWLDKVGTNYLKRYNEEVIPPLDETFFNFLKGIFSRDPELKFTLNAAFIQLVAQAVTAEGGNKLEALYESYLQDKRVEPYANTDDFGDYDHKAKVDWSDKEATNFGTERNSPEMLRNYAYALMEKAYALDSSIFVSNQYEDWTNRLLGLKGAFSCSAVLSDMMVEHGKKKFPETLMSIMPPAWS